MGDSEHERFIDTYLTRMRNLIDSHGVAVQGVAGEGEPPFAYTVGLGRHDQPEVIVFGLPMPVAQALLNDLAAPILDGRLRLGHGDTVHGLVEGYPVRLLAVTDSSTHLTPANRFYQVPGRPPVAALQMVFPDPEGRWPWQPGSGVAEMPLLGPVPTDADGTVHTLA